MPLEFNHGAINWLHTDALNTVYTVSGLSFQPKAIRFYWQGTLTGTDATTQAESSRRGIGFATGTSARRCVTTYDQDGSSTTICASARFDDCIAAVHSTTLDGKLDLNSITSDGFTLIVDDVPTAGVSVFWEAWGGSDITVAAVGDIDEPSATGNVDYDVTGFTSGGTNQVVLFAGVQSTAATGTIQALHSGLSIGMADGTSNAVITSGSLDSSATTSTHRYGSSEACLAQVISSGGNLNAKASLTQFGTNNFRLNWANRNTTDRRSIFLAIKGGRWKVGELTIDSATLNATATVSGLTLTPKGLMLFSISDFESAGVTVNTNEVSCLGTGTSPTSRRSQGQISEDSTANSEIDLVIQYDQVLSIPTTAGGLLVAYDISSMAHDGFTLINDTGGGSVTEWIGYLTFGSESSLLVSLISYWPLDEAAGNALDSLGANDLTDTNTVAGATQSGKINGARDFEFSNSEYFTHADNTDLSTGDINFTLQAWVKLETKTAFRPIVSKLNSSGTASEYLVCYDNTSDRFQIRITGNGSAWQATLSANNFGSPSTGAWYLIHAWHDATNNQIGISVNAGTPDTTSYTTGSTDTTSPFNIGSYGDGGAGDFFDGLIDEVGFWKRVLTSSERSQLYNGGSGLPYPFDLTESPHRYPGLFNNSRALLGGVSQGGPILLRP